MIVYLRHFILPLVGYGLISLITLYYSELWFQYRDFLLAFPYVIFLPTAALSIYLLQYGFAYLALLFCATYALIQLYLQTSLSNPLILAIFLFMNLAFPLLLLSTAGLAGKSLKSLGVWLLLLAVSSLLWLPPLLTQGIARQILGGLPVMFVTRLQYDSGLSLGLLLVYLPTLALLVLLYSLYPSRLRAVWVGGCLMMLVVCVFFAVPFISALAFSVFAVWLLIAQCQDAFSLAFVDELTNIPGRQALQKQLQNLGRRYTIAMVDVDHFKSFNDTYGHDIGDQVLRMVAAKISQVGGGGKAFRFGGEEFIVLFPGKEITHAREHLEVIRQHIADYKMQVRDSKRPGDDKVGRKRRGAKYRSGVAVTISIGVAQKNKSARSAPAVIKQADNALYKAKEAGRNCLRAG